jgi:hypothetical protein
MRRWSLTGRSFAVLQMFVGNPGNPLDKPVLP